ncbi:hypothetical protein TELCIR_02385 [Teladorsagia circumcincta]|uniref:Uncharacterized protein n=1 Tax=Teladorsagia circumcincta TaxID=45464 RepID=A0A2G9UZD8_TELCI|nr:hypothetical protein TELCIR_02385 [Teladorsagia circumcincta]
MFRNYVLRFSSHLGYHSVDHLVATGWQYLQMKEIGCVLLANKGFVEGFNCNENTPETLQKILLDALNDRRHKLLSYLPNLVYNCNLAGEAYTGEWFAGIMHDGFMIEGDFVNWQESLFNLVDRVLYGKEMEMDAWVAPLIAHVKHSAMASISSRLELLSDVFDGAAT